MRYTAREILEEYAASYSEVDVDKLAKLLNNICKASVKEFAEQVEFHSVATVGEFGEQFTITKTGLEEIMRETFQMTNEEIKNV